MPTAAAGGSGRSGGNGSCCSYATTLGQRQSGCSGHCGGGNGGSGEYRLGYCAGDGQSGSSGSNGTNGVVDVSPLGCPFMTGACCDTFDGNCTNDVDAGDCDGPYEDFYPGQTCAEAGCYEATGACCNESTAVCEPDVNIADCLGNDRDGETGGRVAPWNVKDGPTRFIRDGACEEFHPACGEIPVPTVSEWGLIVLVLLVLTAAVVIFGRRRLSADA